MPDPDLLLRQPWIAAARSLTGDQRKIADVLLDLLEATPALQLLGEDGLAYAVTGAVHASQARLAELAGVSRKVARAALERLRAAGAVDMAADEGPHGGVIALIGAAWVRPWIAGIGPVRKLGGPSPIYAGPVVSALVARMCSEIPSDRADRGPVEGPVNQADRGPVGSVATSRDASQVPGDIYVKGPVNQADRGPVGSRQNQPSTTGYPQAAGGRSSPGIESGSAQIRDGAQLPLTGTQASTISDPGSASAPRSGSGSGDLGSPRPKASLSEAQPNGPGEIAKAPRRKPGKRAAALADIPVAADLADRFRQFVIRQQPGSVLAAVTDLEWSASEQRLTWARQLAKLLDRLTIGSEPIAAHAMMIRRVLGWLVTDQGASEARYRIIVLSPSALAEKWDRILTRYSPIAAAPAPESVHPSALRTRAT